MEFLDINDLSIEELDEISHLSKALSVDMNQAIKIWRVGNPGRIKSLGKLNNNGEFEHNEITEEGVKEHKGDQGFKNMIESVLKRKKK